jgi:tetratricopeptide (TPR) repeat protein
MRRTLLTLMAGLAIICPVTPVMPDRASAATGEASDEQIDSAPCMAAMAANDDDGIMAACGPLIDNDKAPKADRIKALVARGAAYGRKDQIDRAIGDYDLTLRLDPTLADIFNSRGELWRKKGDRPRALADFGAAIRLSPNHVAAKANYKSLALEIERLGAMIAVNNRPSFNCATARRAVEKAICANPELANLDREINAVNTKVVREATRDNPRAGRSMQREQDDFIARRNAEFGRPDFDLQKVMRERLDHLMAIERHHPLEDKSLTEPLVQPRR